MQVFNTYLGSWARIFEKKCNQMRWAYKWRLRCEKAWLEWRRWNELLFALLWNVCCRATKCSLPNMRADGLSLEIHFFLDAAQSLWRVGLYKHISASAPISLLHFWLPRAIFPLFAPHCVFFLCAALIPFVKQSFFTRALSYSAWYRLDACFKQPDESWGKWKPHSGNTMHDWRCGLRLAA